MSTSQTSGADALFVEFEDNALLVELCGEHDRNLARIEQKLDVSLVPRGNRIAIMGGDDGAAAARDALKHLYSRAENGLEVEAGDVDGAVRLAQAGRIGEKGGQKGPGANTIFTGHRSIAARSAAQIDYVRALREREMVVGLGPAGTGKTFLAVAVAVAMLHEGAVERIILTRPAVEAGERLGFLPGDLKEKIDPYMQPMYDALRFMMSPERARKLQDSEVIEVAPLAYMRGRTLSNAFIILDEAQNTTPTQMKMFLTRMGENSRMTVTGDISQIDLPLGNKSGLVDALDILKGLKEVAICRFTDKDVVRHNLVTRIVRAYDERDRDMLGDG